MHSFLKKQVRINKKCVELMLREIHKDMQPKYLLYFLSAPDVSMYKHAECRDSFDVAFIFKKTDEDYCKVYLFLEKVVFKYNPGKKSTGYYCTIYHFDKEGNDTAQSFFIKCNDKLRKKLILMYKKWLKNGLDM